MAIKYCAADMNNVKSMSKSKIKIETPKNISTTTEQKHYIFLLVGKTGSGRSATGNSILGENYFVSSDAGSSTSGEISTKTTLREKIKATVIDTTGILDISVGSDGAKTKACTDLTTAMTECPKDGKVIIVLVLKYGERFTEENRQTFYILKNIFGDDYLWKSCIIIMTHGDVFNTNNEAGINFEGWAENQKDDLGKMFKDCSYRCLLYNNKTKNQEERKQQFEKLILFSDQIDQGYTMTIFSDSGPMRRRHRLALEEKLTDVKKKLNTKIKELFFSSSVISERDDSYVAFTKSVDKFRNELNILDNKGIFYYEEGELLFLNEERDDLNDLEEDVNTRVTLNKLKKS